MAVKILLSKNKWTEHKVLNNVFYFVGYLDFCGKMVNNADDLVELFMDKINSNNTNSFLENEFLPFCNGNFAIIFRLGNRIIAITDYLRNFQILYYKTEKDFIITDYISDNIKKNLVVDNENCEEFLLSGFVMGEDTVFKDLKSLQTSEILYVSDNNQEKKRYFIWNSYPNRKTSTIEKKYIFEKMDDLFLTAFKRMIKSKPNVRKWIVPLSGGHDSRLIINYLYRLGVKNVVCFTYGIEQNEEVRISKQTADALGFEWHFIDYSNDKDWIDLHKSDLFDDYINYSFNGCNLSHVQDLLALKTLITKGIIKKGDVIIPGHTAFTESESNDVYKFETENDILNYIISKYYFLFNKKDISSLKNRLLELLHENHQTTESFLDFFNWQERQVKFIGNSVRAYEFFGLDWRMPFWEKDIINFWQAIDYKDRIERKILISASKNKLFVKELLDVPIINKFDKPKEKVGIINKLIPIGVKSIITAIINWQSKVPVGTNQTFVGRGKTIKDIVKPLDIYPKNIKKHIKPYLVRRPYQMNINSLMAIYTLRNEVFIKNKMD